MVRNPLFYSISYSSFILSFYRSGDDFYSLRISHITNSESSWSDLQINCLLSLREFGALEGTNWDFLSDHHATKERERFAYDSTAKSFNKI